MPDKLCWFESPGLRNRLGASEYETLKSMCSGKRIELRTLMKFIYEKSKGNIKNFVLHMCRKWRVGIDSLTSMLEDCEGHHAQEFRNRLREPQREFSQEPESGDMFARSSSILQTQLGLSKPKKPWTRLDIEDMCYEYHAYKTKELKRRREEQRRLEEQVRLEE